MLVEVMTTLVILVLLLFASFTACHYSYWRGRHHELSFMLKASWNVLGSESDREKVMDNLAWETRRETQSRWGVWVAPFRRCMTMDDITKGSETRERWLM